MQNITIEIPINSMLGNQDLNEIDFHIVIGDKNNMQAYK